MLIQFSTGSIEDREASMVAVDVHNAGIQASNVVCTLTANVGSRRDVLSKRLKVAPRSELSVLRAQLEGTEDPELVIEVDSPSLIISVKAETRRPLNLKVVTLTDGRDACDGAAVGTTLFSGTLYRGDPF